MSRLSNFNARNYVKSVTISETNTNYEITSEIEAAFTTTFQNLFRTNVIATQFPQWKLLHAVQQKQGSKTYLYPIPEEEDLISFAFLDRWAP